MADFEPKRSWMRVLLSIPLRFKITVPYLIVASLLAGLATYQVARIFVSTLEERFQAQLQDASFRVADGFLEVEQSHLSATRTILYTLGTSEAVAESDIGKITSVIFPQVVNNELYYVDVLDEHGIPLITWHRTAEALEYSDRPAEDYDEWPSVRAVLTRQSDETGDKFAEIAMTPWGPAVYTASPILLNDELVGVLLVGSPLSEIVPDLALSSLSNVTAYAPDGYRSKSTFDNREPVPVVGEATRAYLNTNTDITLTRDFASGSREYVEALDTIYLRGVPSGWYYGVALPKSLVRDTGVPTLLPVVAIFILGVFALIGLGILVAQLIAIPIFRLLNASEQVGGGNFETQVPVYADDEVGMLTEGFNLMVRELAQREFVREMFGRMVSQDISEAVLQGGLDLGGETRFVSVLFTDMRDFTAISEKVSPDDMIRLLNQFFAIITEATRKNQGVINHFGGDSVLAVFGAPIERTPTETIHQAILTALEIRRGMVELNAERISNSLAPLQYGVGINSGEVTAGKIGTEERFHYTVIGDVVNVAARLQGISRQFPRTPLLIPEAGLSPVKDGKAFEFQYLGEFRLKGKENPVSTYAVVGLDPQLPPEFTAFDPSPYPKSEALLACYLYCQGFSPQVIAEALQIGVSMIERWIEIAKENADPVGGLLAEFYQLATDQLVCLQENEAASPGEV